MQQRQHAEDRDRPAGARTRQPHHCPPHTDDAVALRDAPVGADTLAATRRHTTSPEPPDLRRSRRVVGQRSPPCSLSICFCTATTTSSASVRPPFWSGFWIAAGLLFGVVALAVAGRSGGRRLLRWLPDREGAVGRQRLRLRADLQLTSPVPPRYQHKVLFWGSSAPWSSVSSSSSSAPSCSRRSSGPRTCSARSSSTPDSKMAFRRYSSTPIPTATRSSGSSAGSCPTDAALSRRQVLHPARFTAAPAAGEAGAQRVGGGPLARCSVAYARRTASSARGQRLAGRPQAASASASTSRATTRLRTSSAGQSTGPPGPVQRLLDAGRRRAARRRTGRRACRREKSSDGASRRRSATGASSPTAVAGVAGGEPGRRRAAPAGPTCAGVERVVRLDHGQHRAGVRLGRRRSRPGPAPRSRASCRPCRCSSGCAGPLAVRAARR